MVLVLRSVSLDTVLIDMYFASSCGYLLVLEKPVSLVLVKKGDLMYYS